MGFQTLSPAVATISPITPAAKDVQVKAFTVARTETASVLKASLPADASILHIVREAGTASDAATTATVTITVANNGGTVSSKADDVKGSGASTGFVGMTNLPNLQPMPLNGDLTITAVYAETGTASTTGGPWNYIVTYVR
jgi:hypothetical protein